MRWSAVLAGLVCLVGPAWAAPTSPTTETIVLVRHGEKPAAGLGQLDCQGLNRALALPAVLRRGFGQPAALFAPDPAEKKRDAGVAYDYVRPLATIEPTAIAFGMPIAAGIGVSQLGRLQQALEMPALHAGVVFVAWEHRAIVTLARTMLTAHGGTATSVPDWAADDFDGMFVLRLAWTGNQAQASFERRTEGLDGQSTLCPAG